METRAADAESPSGFSKISAIGTTISLVCAVHCMAVPLMVLLLPLGGLTFLAHDGLELVLIGSAAVLATVSLCWGFRVHGRRSTFVVLASGLLLVATGRAMMETPYHGFLVAGGLLVVATSQLWNRHLCRSCDQCAVHSH